MASEKLYRNTLSKHDNEDDNCNVKKRKKKNVGLMTTALNGVHYAF